MKALLFVTALAFPCSLLTAQSLVWAPDSLMEADAAYTVNRYHNTLRYHETPMYLTVPYVTPIMDRKLSLEDGEGKNGAIAEGHFGYRFVIYKGKYYHRAMFQRTRLTFDVSLLLRLANDHSLPLLPTNNKFGLGLDFLLSNPRRLSNANAVPVWLTLQLHHYSNGQAGSFFINDPEQRNNYVDGDFSTNYARAILNVACLEKQKSLLSGYLGFQHEVDPGGPLERSNSLKNYYGDQRVLFGFQWVVRSKIVTSQHTNFETASRDKVAVQKRRQFCFRTELDYIVDNVSRFTSDNKYRVGWHTYTSFMPSVTNEVGFILHTYVGRDYLNIRFDDVVFIGAAGVCVKFNNR